MNRPRVKPDSGDLLVVCPDCDALVMVIRGRPAFWGCDGWIHECAEGAARREHDFLYGTSDIEPRGILVVARKRRPWWKFW